MTSYTIWALDNVLADDSWRRQFIDRELPYAERRKVYDILSIYDDPITTQEFEQSRDKDLEPIFIVDRPETLRAHVAIWITDSLGVANPKLYMRRIGDHRPLNDFFVDAVHEVRDRYGIDEQSLSCVYIDSPSIARQLVKEFNLVVNMINRDARSLIVREASYK